MAYTKPTVAEFKEHFSRDFPYNADPALGVTDSDITKAIKEAEASMNAGIIPSQEVFTLAYLYLTAHFLVIDLRNASQGVEGSYSWITASKSVGSVSESFAIPQKISDSPLLSMFTKTNYGAKYLHMLLPYLVGRVFSVYGRTHP